jgi:hypothetical protein
VISVHLLDFLVTNNIAVEAAMSAVMVMMIDGDSGIAGASVGEPVGEAVAGAVEVGVALEVDPDAKFA